MGALAMQPNVQSWPMDLLGPAFAELAPEIAGLYARFVPCPLSSSDYLSHGEIRSRSDVALLVLLRAVSALIYKHRAGFYSVLTRGYLMYSRRRLQQILASSIELFSPELRVLCSEWSLADADAIAGALGQIVGCSWPLVSGPVLRHEGDVVCVDICAATKLFLGFEPALKSGTIANARATDFEFAVQSAIDSTQWKPSTAIAEIRGRTLKYHGRAITDIDAVGENNGRLLLVSCKSLPYRHELDAGTYKNVRNASSLVQDAVTAWQEKVNFLQQNPVGDNYNFTVFGSTVRTVCLPQVAWTPLGPATSMEDYGVRASCSLSELSTWLRHSSAPDAERNGG